MRRLVCSRSSLVGASAVQPQTRGFWDPTSHHTESSFMDRKDFAQMFPVQKPETTGGMYGWNNPGSYGIFAVSYPTIRLPHERRRLNPRPAKRVTVYGASGYLGAEITREFLEHPEIEKVRATTRYPTLIPAGSDLDKLLQQYPDKLELHECDVTDRIQVNVAANGSDTLVFAVDFHNEYANNSHLDVFVTGGGNVAWSARSVRAERVIFCNGLDATFASESNYVDMRARAEDCVATNFPDATLLRFGPLYGKNYRYRGLGKYFYPACFPNVRVQPTWVVDAARSVVRASRANRAVRMKLDLGGPQTVLHVDMMRQMARLWRPRIVVPMYRGIGRFFARFTPWTVPNPWFDDNWLLTWELPQVNRSAKLFDRLASWDHIHYKPHTMEEAAEIEKGARTLEPLAELDKPFQAVEAAEKAAFKEAEELAKKHGVHRAKAEPGFGRADGMEMLAQEIYPGQQFRMRPLADAKYPSTVKHPGPVAMQ